MEKYLDLLPEKLKNRKVTSMPIVVSVFGLVPKGLEKKLSEVEITRRIETIQTTAMSKSV